MEFVGDEIDYNHFHVADFSSETVFSSIKLTDHIRSLDRSRSGDKPDYRLIVAQQFPSPVGGDEREEADERLGGKVENKFRLIFFESLGQPVEIADISMNMSYFLPEPRCLKVVGLARGRKGIADDVRPQFPMPDRQPRPFETHVAGDQRGPFL